MARRTTCGIPAEIGHAEKWQLALDMIDETRSWGIDVPLVVADGGYGDAAAFRLGLEERELSYAVGISTTTTANPTALRYGQYKSGTSIGGALLGFRIHGEMRSYGSSQLVCTLGVSRDFIGRMATHVHLVPSRPNPHAACISHRAACEPLQHDVPNRLKVVNSTAHRGIDEELVRQEVADTKVFWIKISGLHQRLAIAEQSLPQFSARLFLIVFIGSEEPEFPLRQDIV